MTTADLQSLLLWCVGMNYGLLLVWFGAFIVAHDWMYRTHRRWFKLSIETFDAIHYAGMAFYKISIVLLNLVPLMALYLTSSITPSG